MKSKKAGSHVGFILSFILFVFFIMFMFVLLFGQDRGRKSEKDFVLDALSDELIKYTTTEIASVSLKTGTLNPSSPSCIQVTDPISIKESKVLVIRDDAGILSPKEGYVEGANLLIKDTDSSKYYTVYYSDSFESSISFTGCSPLIEASSIAPGENEYVLGQLKRERYVYVDLINDMNEKYKSDYSDLKKELKIPEGNEFYFIFEYENPSGSQEVISPGDNYAGAENLPQSSEIYSEKYNIVYFDEEANIKTGVFTIQVW